MFKMPIPMNQESISKKEAIVEYFGNLFALQSGVGRS